MPRARAVILDGITYPTLTAAADAIGATASGITFALKDGRRFKGHTVAWVPEGAPVQLGAHGHDGPLLKNPITSRTGVYREQKV